MSDEYFMQAALEQAELAVKKNEVPVGAVLVQDNEIIARSHNQPITLADPTAHAEVLVLREAAKNIGNYRVIRSTLYVTLEPCLMCVGAMVHARVERCVFGASDPKSGALQMACDAFECGHFNHKFSVTQGVLPIPCGELLKNFFKERRQ